MNEQDKLPESHQRVIEDVKRLLRVLSERRSTGKYVFRLTAYQGGVRNYEIAQETEVR